MRFAAFDSTLFDGLMVFLPTAPLAVAAAFAFVGGGVVSGSLLLAVALGYAGHIQLMRDVLIAAETAQLRAGAAQRTSQLVLDRLGRRTEFEGPPTLRYERVK